MRICKNVRYIQTVTSTFSCPKYHYYVYFFVLMQLPVWKLWPSVFAKYQRMLMLLGVRRLRRNFDLRPVASTPSRRRQTYMHYSASRIQPCLPAEMEPAIGITQKQDKRKGKMWANRIRGKVSSSLAHCCQGVYGPFFLSLEFMTFRHKEAK